MKNFNFILSVIALLILGGCVKEPYADFVASKTVVSPGEVIFFTNRSYDAASFEWDFGDGYFSVNFNVSHFYEDPGLYNVRLTAFGKDNRTNRYIMDIEVLSTDLLISVREWYDQYPVNNASVILYPSLSDWENFTNPIIEEFTNANGTVLFTNLNPGMRYYVDVYEANHDNYALAAEDAGWITTDRLVFGEVNNFTAWVDYYTSGKKSSLEREDIRKLRMRSSGSEEIRKREMRVKE